jgi:hypothetical protein
MTVQAHHLAELFKQLFADKNELRTFLRGWQPVGPDVIDNVADGPFATFRHDVADALRARGALKAPLAELLRDALIALRPGFVDEVRAVFGGAPTPTPAPAPVAVPPGGRPDVFIAHASADKARAAELYEALFQLGLKPYMDDKQVRDGAWDLVLRKQLGAARLVVVLHSNSYAQAHYLRDEAALAIELHRKDAAAHRLRVVYLDGFPADPANKPAGYGIINHLLWQPGGAAQVAAELARDLAQPAGVP